MGLESKFPKMQVHNRMGASRPQSSNPWLYREHPALFELDELDLAPRCTNPEKSFFMASCTGAFCVAIRS